MRNTTINDSMIMDIEDEKSYETPKMGSNIPENGNTNNMSYAAISEESASSFKFREGPSLSASNIEDMRLKRKFS